jgi:hypothetical protein
MEVWINDKSIAVAGGEDFDLLTLGVMSAPESAYPVAILTGRKRGTEESLQWLNTPLKLGDRVQGILRAGGAATRPPNVEQLESKEVKVPVPGWPRVFVVRTQAQISRVSSDDSGTLMVTATWHHLYEHCRLEVTRFPKREKDPNRCWFESRAQFDEPITIEIK